MTLKPTYEELSRIVDDLKKRAFESDITIKQLAPIFQYSLDLIGSGNLQGYFRKINPSITNLLGYTEEEFLNAPFTDFIHPEDVEPTQKALQAAAAGQKVIEIANRYRCKDGNYKWIDWRVQVFVDENLFIAVGRDITEGKMLENGLRLSEKKFRNIIQTATDGFIQAESSGKITDCNSAYLLMTGYTREELLTKSIPDIDSSGDRDEITSQLRQLSETGGGVFESVHRRKDGSTFHVEISTRFLSEEKLFISFVRDISERKYAAMALQESEERFRQLAESIPEVFWLGSLDWREIYYISPAYEDIWGRKCEELYQKPLSWLDSVIEDDRAIVQDAIPKTIDEANRTVVFPEYRVRHPSGEIRWIHARAFPIKNHAGKTYRIAGIAADVTEAKRDMIERENLVGKLEDAVAQVKTLRGFIPICASCKKIRDDRGYWEEVESYLKLHSEAEFTHSICPDCVEKIYPGFTGKDEE